MRRKLAYDDRLLRKKLPGPRLDGPGAEVGGSIQYSLWNLGHWVAGGVVSALRDGGGVVSFCLIHGAITRQKKSYWYLLIENSSELHLT